MDITNAPAAAADAPASEIRVFIGRLTGVDATSIRGLLTQALFESKKVVITENQSNASLILQGRVLRRQIPVRPTAPGGQKRRARKTRAADTTNSTVV